jgi:outer membrane protein assembly factor BamB
LVFYQFTQEERTLLHGLFGPLAGPTKTTVGDAHPDAAALRLQLHLVCQQCREEVPHGWDADEDYAWYCTRWHFVSVECRLTMEQEEALAHALKNHPRSQFLQFARESRGRLGQLVVMEAPSLKPQTGGDSWHQLTSTCDPGMYMRQIQGLEGLEGAQGQDEEHPMFSFMYERPAAADCAGEGGHHTVQRALETLLQAEKKNKLGLPFMYEWLTGALAVSVHGGRGAGITCLGGRRMRTDDLRMVAQRPGGEGVQCIFHEYHMALVDHAAGGCVRIEDAAAGTGDAGRAGGAAANGAAMEGGSAATDGASAGSGSAAGGTELAIKLWGAGGAGAESGRGGAGGFVKGTYLANPDGETITIVVGDGGRVHTNRSSRSNPLLRLVTVSGTASIEGSTVELGGSRAAAGGRSRRRKSSTSAPVAERKGSASSAVGGGVGVVCKEAGCTVVLPVSAVAAGARKLFYEVTIPALAPGVGGVAGESVRVGWVDPEFSGRGLSWWVGSDMHSWGCCAGGLKYHKGKSSSLAGGEGKEEQAEEKGEEKGEEGGVVIGVAADLDSGALAFSINGVWAPPIALGSPPAVLKPAVSIVGADSPAVELNFGDRVFAFPPPSRVYQPALTALGLDPKLGAMDGATDDLRHLWEFPAASVFEGYRIRAQRDFSAAGIAQLARGDIFDVSDQEGEWVRVHFQKKAGWASKFFDGFDDDRGPQQCIFPVGSAAVPALGLEAAATAVPKRHAKGDKVRVLSPTCNWRTCEVVALDPAKPKQIKVHYDGYASQFDEWVEVGGDRLASCAGAGSSRFRLKISKTRRHAQDQNGASTQLSQVKLFSNGVPVPVVRASNPGGRAPKASVDESVHQLLKVDRDTKWTDMNFAKNKSSTLIFELATRAVVTEYQLTTGNDDSGRDPVSWTLEAEISPGKWEQLDERADAEKEVPAGRKSATPFLKTKWLGWVDAAAVTVDTDERSDGRVYSISFSPDGTQLVVPDSKHSNVHCYDVATGKAVWKMSSAQSSLKTPYGVSVLPGGATGCDLLVLSDALNHRIKLFDLNTQKPLSGDRAGAASIKDGSFNKPKGSCITASGHVAIADECNHRIQLFERTAAVRGGAHALKWVSSFGSKGGKLGASDAEFQYPVDVACSIATGNLIVADCTNTRLSVWSPDGSKWIRHIGSRGSGDGEFEGPVSVAVTATGLVIASDKTGRVLMFNEGDGAFVGNLVGPEQMGPGAWPAVAVHAPTGVVAVYSDIKKTAWISKPGAVPPPTAPSGVSSDPTADPAEDGGAGGDEGAQQRQAIPDTIIVARPPTAGRAGGRLHALKQAGAESTAVWAASVPYHTASPTLSLDRQVVFVATEAGEVIAMATGSGETMWTAAVGPVSYSSPTLSPDGKILYVGSQDKKLYALDTRTGAVLSKVATKGKISSSPIVSADGKTVFVGSGDNCVHAIEAGAQRRASGAGMKLMSLVSKSTKHRWQFATKGNVRSRASLSADGSTLFVGSDDGAVYAVDTATGKQVWKFLAGAPVSSTPTPTEDGELVLVGADDGVLVAVHAATGDVVWRHTGTVLPSSDCLLALRKEHVTPSPAISADGSVAFFSSAQSGQLTALTVDSGQLMWTFAHSSKSALDCRVMSTPQLADDEATVVVCDVQGSVFGVSAETGKQSWSSHEPAGAGRQAVCAAVVLLPAAGGAGQRGSGRKKAAAAVRLLRQDWVHLLLDALQADNAAALCFALSQGEGMLDLLATRVHATRRDATQAIRRETGWGLAVAAAAPAVLVENIQHRHLLGAAGDDLLALARKNSKFRCKQQLHGLRQRDETARAAVLRRLPLGGGLPNGGSAFGQLMARAGGGGGGGGVHAPASNVRTAGTRSRRGAAVRVQGGAGAGGRGGDRRRWRRRGVGRRGGRGRRRWRRHAARSNRLRRRWQHGQRQGHRRWWGRWRGAARQGDDHGGGRRPGSSRQGQEPQCAAVLCRRNGAGLHHGPRHCRAAAHSRPRHAVQDQHDERCTGVYGQGVERQVVHLRAGAHAQGRAG